jgi:hypothetical protein
MIFAEEYLEMRVNFKVGEPFLCTYYELLLPNEILCSQLKLSNKPMELCKISPNISYNFKPILILT